MRDKYAALYKLAQVTDQAEWELMYSKLHNQMKSEFFSKNANIFRQACDFQDDRDGFKLFTLTSPIQTIFVPKNPLATSTIICTRVPSIFFELFRLIAKSIVSSFPLHFAFQSEDAGGINFRNHIFSMITAFYNLQKVTQSQQQKMAGISVTSTPPPFRLSYLLNSFLNRTHLHAFARPMDAGVRYQEDSGYILTIFNEDQAMTWKSTVLEKIVELCASCEDVKLVRNEHHQHYTIKHSLPRTNKHLLPAYLILPFEVTPNVGYCSLFSHIHALPKCEAVHKLYSQVLQVIQDAFPLNCLLIEDSELKSAREDCDYEAERDLIVKEVVKIIRNKDMVLKLYEQRDLTVLEEVLEQLFELSKDELRSAFPDLKPLVKMAIDLYQNSGNDSSPIALKASHLAIKLAYMDREEVIEAFPRKISRLLQYHHDTPLNQRNQVSVFSILEDTVLCRAKKLNQNKQQGKTSDKLTKEDLVDFGLGMVLYEFFEMETEVSLCLVALLQNKLEDFALEKYPIYAIQLVQEWMQGKGFFPHVKQYETLQNFKKEIRLLYSLLIGTNNFADLCIEPVAAENDEALDLASTPTKPATPSKAVVPAAASSSSAVVAAASAAAKASFYKNFTECVKFLLKDIETEEVDDLLHMNILNLLNLSSRNSTWKVLSTLKWEHSLNKCLKKYTSGSVKKTEQVNSSVALLLRCFTSAISKDTSLIHSFEGPSTANKLSKSLLKILKQIKDNYKSQERLLLKSTQEVLSVGLNTLQLLQLLAKVKHAEKIPFPQDELSTWKKALQLASGYKFTPQEQGDAKLAETFKHLAIAMQTFIANPDASSAANSKANAKTPAWVPETCTCCKKKENFKGEFLSCSRCKKATYCGKECQLKDWKDGHKNSCQPAPAAPKK